jgi:3-hydroxyacyl-[acyl-carrier-protein] dehydratase
MLAGKLYTLEQTLQEAADSVTYRIVLNAQHPVFEGHFPGQPVLPGVTMMQTIQELLEKKLGQKVILKKASNMKFLNMIAPAVNPELDATIQHKEQDGEIRVTASLKFEALVFMKFQGSFVAAS